MDDLKVGDKIFYEGRDWIVHEINPEYLVVLNSNNPPVGGGCISKIYYNKIRKVSKDDHDRDLVYI